jgi:hypothetical protein
MALMSETCKVRIIRGSRYVDALRSYKIFINDSEVGTLSRDSVLEIDAPSGALRIDARIDWGRSRPLSINISPGRIVEIEVSNEWSSLLALWAITFGKNNYLTLRQLPAAGA